MLLGAHESVAGGLHRALEWAAIDGCKALQVFTKSSGMWREPEMTDAQIAEFRAAHERTGKIPVLAHTSYLINLASNKDDILAKSKDALVREIERSSALGIAFVVLHPGAHLGQGEDDALDRVADALDDVHERTKGKSARILLENTAGQGSCIGHSFEHLGAIFEKTKEKDRMGVCFDTQHAFAAGYDLSTPDGYERTFAKFEREVGLARLAAFHLNDSKKELGSRVDRHEHVGDGILGLPLFWRLANDARFRDVPGVVEIEPRSAETPNKEDVMLLASLVGGPEPKPRPAVFKLEAVPATVAKKKRR